MCSENAEDGKHEYEEESDVDQTRNGLNERLDEHLHPRDFVDGAERA